MLVGASLSTLKSSDITAILAIIRANKAIDILSHGRSVGGNGLESSIGSQTYSSPVDFKMSRMSLKTIER